jgi:hypothetical protein
MHVTKAGDEEMRRLLVDCNVEYARFLDPRA